MGSHLVDLLLERGWEVRILDNLEPVTHPAGKPPWVPAEAEFVQGWVQTPVTVERAVKGCDVVFHQAAYGGFAPDAASKMTAANALGTVAVMEAARQAGVRKVVVASSQAVYGYGIGVPFPEGSMPTPPRFPFAPRDPDRLANADWSQRSFRGRFLHPARLREDDPVDLPTPYALSKHYAEKAALMLGAEFGIPTVALRYSLAYGPRQSVSNPYTGICSIFATRLANGLPPVIYEDGQQTRDFTYVTDVAAANLLVAEDDRADGKVFNVGTGVGTTVMDFAKLLQGELGGPAPECSGDYRPGDARHVVCDASRLRGLGWEPQVTVAEGVARYAEWFLSEGAPSNVPDVGNLLRDAGVVRSVHA